MGKLFCFKWFQERKPKWENSGSTKEGSEWPQAPDPQPFRENRNTDTRHTTPFFLYEEIQSGHIVRKNLSRLVSTLFSLTSLWITIELRGLHSRKPPPHIYAFEYLQTWNILCYIKYMWNYYRLYKCGPWIHSFPIGWNVIYNIQVKSI